MSRKQNRYCTKTECQESYQVTEYQVITTEKHSLNYSYLYSYSDFYCLPRISSSLDTFNHVIFIQLASSHVKMFTTIHSILSVIGITMMIESSNPHVTCPIDSTPQNPNNLGSGRFLLVINRSSSDRIVNNERPGNWIRSGIVFRLYCIRV